MSSEGGTSGNVVPRVCLSVAAYKSDDAVQHLLETAASFGGAPFEKVFVIDSLGSGAIPKLIEARGWSAWVEYSNFNENLGSAGNLYQRLKIPADLGFDWVYAINSDGKLNKDVPTTLVEFATRNPNAGAIYPLRRFPGRQNRFDMTGTTPFPMMFQGMSTPPSGESLEAFWGSSNGCLYSTKPIRSGATPFPDFWMGWEDLAYGWLLQSMGLRQFIVTSAVLIDDYEYTSRNVGPFYFTITDKPAWYAYYNVRNLLLSLQRIDVAPKTVFAVATRLLGELGVTVALRDNKIKRVGLFMEGVRDGLLGRSGKGRFP